ncbi:hypothetical protein C2869_12980 [Saccharobesus litoralis]|uniref:DUF2975 domain-containing protein n=1 Tax=Saccharobesus litoralis TaxID=2172099 RepID=A0A2S0VSW2_9ALTE|nr:DUF2975 domain-containing protein [Saccharobesus litoralis]AWB67299.1 hypothetical protein C2869_12980 [Saccharobesus litoralis]
MEPIGKVEYAKIEKVSRLLIPIMYMVLVSVVVILVGLSISLFTSPTVNSSEFSLLTDKHLGELNINFSHDDLQAGLATWADKIAIFSVLCFVAAFILPGAWSCISLLRLFNQQQVFCQAAVKLARKIAQLYLSFLVVSYITSLLASTVLLNDLNIRISLPTHLVILGLLWMFVWILEIGTTLHEDNKLTV